MNLLRHGPLAACILSFVTGLGCSATAPLRHATAPPALSALSPATPPRPETLPNGLRVLQLPATTPDSPFEASLLLKTGALDDPAHLGGLTALLPEAALLGAQTRGGDDEAPATRALRLGAQLGPVSHGPAIGWFLSGPAHHSDKLIELLADLTQRPTLTATRVNGWTERLREELEERGLTPVMIALGIANSQVIGLGRPLHLSPSAEVLSTITREDLVRHWRQVVRPEQALLVLRGDTEDLALVRTHFASWRSLSPMKRDRRPLCAPARMSAHLITAPDANPGHLIAFAALSAPTDEPEHLQTLMSVLNEPYHGRLASVSSPKLGRQPRAQLLNLGWRANQAHAALVIGVSGTPREALKKLYQAILSLEGIATKTLTHAEKASAQRDRLRHELVTSEAPIHRVIDAGVRALSVSNSDPSAPPRSLSELAEENFRRSKIVLVAIGPVTLAEVLEKLAPVTIWNESGHPIGGAKPLRCPTKTPRVDSRVRGS